MASGFPRVFGLRFKGGRLVGGAHVQDVTDASNQAWLIVGGPDARDALEALGTPPTTEQVKGLLSKHPDWHALRRAGKGDARWAQGSPDERLDLSGGDVLVCLGSGRVPAWPEELARASEPQVRARLLAAAGLTLAPDQLASAASASEIVERPRPSGTDVLPPPQVYHGGAPKVESGKRAGRVPDLVPSLLIFNTAVLLVLLLVTLWPNPDSPPPATGPTSSPTASGAPKPPTEPLTACDVLPHQADAARAFCLRVKEQAAGDGAFAGAIADLEAKLNAVQGERPLTAKARSAWGHAVAAVHARLLLLRYLDANALTRLPHAERPYDEPLASLRDRDVAPWDKAFDTRLPANPAWKALWTDTAVPEPAKLRKQLLTDETRKAPLALIKAAEAASAP